MKQIHFKRKYSAGFGLVEIMVAMLIGMFGVLIMMQVLTVSEEQKRTTTSGNDAMNEGVLALYAIQGDVRMSGFGINDAKVLGCGITLRAGVTLSALAPVVINSASITGADADTDTLLIFYSGSNGTPQGDAVIGAGNTMQTPAAFAVNDWVFSAPVTRAPICNLTLDRVASVTGSGFTLASGVTLNEGDVVFNLGQSYRVIGYAVRNGGLTQCDFSNSALNCGNAGSWTSIASDIVALRVQYGRDTTLPSMDGVVDLYDQTSPTTLCTWSRVPSLRLALVARSTQMEKDDVTIQSPSWDGSSADNPPGSAATPFVLTTNADWKKYRYKVFQTLVPMRNMSWMGVVTGC